MNNEKILSQIKLVKENSVSYRKVYGNKEQRTKDEIGGHIGYSLKEKYSQICPSDEFVNNLFLECAKDLGFEYEQR